MCKNFHVFSEQNAEFLRSMTQKGYVQIPLEFAQDLNWCIKFIKDFNGVTFIAIKDVDASIELDAWDRPGRELLPVHNWVPVPLQYLEIGWSI